MMKSSDLRCGQIYILWFGETRTQLGVYIGENTPGKLQFKMWRNQSGRFTKPVLRRLVEVLGTVDADDYRLPKLIEKLQPTTRHTPVVGTSHRTNA